MPEPAGGSAGNIYDLGYRGYDGPRLGRGATFRALWIAGVRSAFGLGRRPAAKIAPFALAVLAFVPALIQLGIAAVTTGLDADVEVFTHEDYFGYVQVVLILFGAAVASELVGRDQRDRTLALFFSRGVSRTDYALARVAALTTAMLALTLGPQLVLLVGNGMVDDDLLAYLRDNADLVPRIAAASLLLSLVIAGAALAIAAHMPRRAYAAATVVGAFILSLAAATILVETTDSIVGRLAVLAGPAGWEGFIHWIFGVPQRFDGLTDRADLPGWAFAAAAAVTAAVAVGLCVRRFRTVDA